MAIGVRRYWVLVVLSMLATTVAVVAQPAPAAAATFTVTRLDDPTPGPCFAGDCSLREAVLAANFDPATMDTITLPAGTYTLTRVGSDEDSNATGDIDVAGDVEIVGSGEDVTIIDLSALGDRGFHVLSGHVEIANVTIEGARSGEDGAAIFHAGSSLTVVSSTFFDNAIGGFGNGGALSATSPVDIVDSTFERNTTDNGGGNWGDGGAISTSADLVVMNSVFDRNFAGGSEIEAGNGGAIRAGATTKVIGSVFTSNSAGTPVGFDFSGQGGHGGAIYQPSGTLFIESTTFESNSAGSSGTGFLGAGPGGSGGAVWASGGELTVLMSSFVSNRGGSGSGSGSGSGGAIRSSTSSLTVDRSSFDGNWTTDGFVNLNSGIGGPAGDGGAIWTSGETSIVRSTFVDNRTGDGGQGTDFLGSGTGGDGGSGGAIFARDQKLSVSNSTLTGNRTGGGGDAPTTLGSQSGNGGDGGAIAAFGAQLVAFHSTIVRNDAGDSGSLGANLGNPGLGGGIWTDTDGDLSSTVLALNSTAAFTGFDCFTAGVVPTPLTVQNAFLSVDTGCSTTLVGPGNQIGNLGNPLDPELGSLAFNGGPTLTIEPFVGSPLIDAADLGPCQDDQRSVARPQGPACDIGAVEVGGMDLQVVSPGCVAYDSSTSADGPLVSGTPRTVNLVDTGCVPAGAVGAVVSLTAISPQSVGNLRLSEASVLPTGGVVNYTSNGLNNSNTISVPLSFDGEVDVAANNGSTDVRIVVRGHYSADGALQYVPITPCAVADSRTAGISVPTGPFVGPFSSADSYPDVDVVEAFNLIGDNQGGGNTDCGIPSDAAAVLLNTVAIGATGTGGVAIGQGGATPIEPTTNVAPIGLNNAATAMAPVDANGRISGNVLGTGTLHVRLVALGYYVAVGASYTPINPCAAFDSRPGVGAPPTGSFAGKRIAGSTGVTTYQLSGAIPVGQGGESDCGVPSDATAVLVNLVAIQPESVGNFRAYATGTTPTGGVLNFAALSPAATNSNAVVVPLSASGQIDLFTNSPANDANPTVHARGVILGYFG